MRMRKVNEWEKKLLYICESKMRKEREHLWKLEDDFEIPKKELRHKKWDRESSIFKGMITYFIL